MQDKRWQLNDMVFANNRMNYVHLDEGVYHNRLAKMTEEISGMNQKINELLLRENKPSSRIIPNVMLDEIKAKMDDIVWKIKNLRNNDNKERLEPVELQMTCNSLSKMANFADAATTVAGKIDEHCGNKPLFNAYAAAGKRLMKLYKGFNYIPNYSIFQLVSKSEKHTKNAERAYEKSLNAAQKSEERMRNEPPRTANKTKASEKVEKSIKAAINEWGRHQKQEFKAKLAHLRLVGKKETSEKTPIAPPQTIENKYAIELRKDQRVINRIFMKSRLGNEKIKAEFYTYLGEKLSKAEDIEKKKDILKEVFKDVKKSFASGRSRIDRAMLFLRKPAVSLARGALGIGLASFSLIAAIPTGGISLSLLPAAAIIRGAGRYIGTNGMWDFGHYKITTRKSQKSKEYGLAAQVFYNASDKKLESYVDRVYNESGAKKIEIQTISNEMDRFAKNIAKQRIIKKTVALIATFLPFLAGEHAFAGIFGKGHETVVEHASQGATAADSTHAAAQTGKSVAISAQDTIAHASGNTIPAGNAAGTISAAANAGEVFTVGSGEGAAHIANQFCKTLPGFATMDMHDKAMLCNAVKNSILSNPEKFGLSAENFMLPNNGNTELWMMKGSKAVFNGETHAVFQKLLNSILAGGKSIPAGMRSIDAISATKNFAMKILAR